MATSGSEITRLFAAAVLIASATGYSVSQPCVRVSGAVDSSPCPCDAVSVAFSVTAGAVNVKAASITDISHGNLHKKRDDDEAAKLVCPATGASLLVDFGAPVTAINSHSVRTIVNNADFFVENLEAGPSEFTVTLDTCGVAAGTRLVTSVAYADAEGNRADVSGLLSAGSVAECSRASAARRKLHDDHFDCSVCESLTSAEIEALAKYDNGGKKIVCDPTCLDGVTDPLHCNYFGLGQICRGCGDCSDCEPCPDAPSPAPELTATDAPVPTSAPEPADDAPVSMSVPEPPVPVAPTPATPAAEDDDDDSEYDCSVCVDLSSEEEEALAAEEGGEKVIVCDPTCLDGVTDPLHCNYFGLGQICRACGDCDDCEPCPDAPAPTPTPAAPSTEGGDDDAGVADDDAEYDCAVCSDLSDEEEEALALYDNEPKEIVCDPTCLDGESDPGHCNYFGLGQVCRGCGDCDDCDPCP